MQSSQSRSGDSEDPLEQWSPTFLAPGTGFVEDNFSTDRGWRGDGSGGNTSDGKQQMKLGSFAHHSPPAVCSGS